jgi:hypothetical protein
MHSQGKKVVFDIDDLMIDPDLADTKVIDGIRSNAHPEAAVRELFASVRRAMLAADVCIASTQELAYHMRWAGKTTHVLFNGFDDQTWASPSRRLRAYCAKTNSAAWCCSRPNRACAWLTWRNTP